MADPKILWEDVPGYQPSHRRRAVVESLGHFEVRHNNHHYVIYYNGSRTSYWANTMAQAQDTVQRIANQKAIVDAEVIPHTPLSLYLVRSRWDEEDDWWVWANSPEAAMEFVLGYLGSDDKVKKTENLSDASWIITKIPTNAPLIPGFVMGELEESFWEITE